MPPHHEPPSHLLTSWMVTQKSKKEPDPQWLSEEALQIAEERREAKGKGERERHTQLKAEFQRIARRDKKAQKNGKD